MAAAENKRMNVVRIYADKEGNSKFGSFSVSMKSIGNIGFLSEKIGCSGIIFRETPGDYDYPWHTAPRRQFIVNLDADLEVEVSSGEKKIIRQGEVFFVEDTTGKGHYSRAVGGKTRRSLFLPVGDEFVASDL